MASRNNVHGTSLATVIFLIQTQVCFLNADENFLELHFEIANLNLNSSDLKIFRPCLCNSSYTFEYFKPNSCNQSTIDADQPGQDISSNIHFHCGYSQKRNKGGMTCRRTKSSLENITGERANFSCGESCVEILWENATVLNMSSELKDNCTDSTKTTTSEAVTTSGFHSATTSLATSNTPLIQSLTATTVSLSPAPVSTGCNNTPIIASAASICTVLIILTLVIIVFLRKRNKEKLQPKPHKLSLQSSNNMCLPDAHVGDRISTHSPGNAELQLGPSHPNIGAICTTSADASRDDGGNDDVAGYVSVRGCHLTNVYATLRGQPSCVPDTYDTVGNVVKVVDDKTCNTATNSGLTTRHQQGEKVTTDRSTNFQLAGVNNDINSVHKSNLPSNDHPVYTQVVKKPKRKSKKVESTTVISDSDLSDCNSSNNSAASTAEDVEERLSHQDSTTADVYNILS